jgi:hypothetical protein
MELSRRSRPAGAAEVTLTAEDLPVIDDILPNGRFGNRYPEAMKYDGLSRKR